MDNLSVEPLHLVERTTRSDLRIVEGRRRALLQVASPLGELDWETIDEALTPYRHSGRWIIVGLRRVDAIESWLPQAVLRLIADVHFAGGQIGFIVRPGSRVEQTLTQMGVPNVCPLFRSAREGWARFWDTTGAVG